MHKKVIKISTKRIVDTRKYRKTKFKDYLASIDGEIYSMLTNTVLSPRIDKDGYQQVSIMVNGKQTSKTVHRMIAEAWLPNPDKKPFVNHKNGNRDDNRVCNLEWVTVSENNLGKNKNNGKHYIHKERL